MRTTPLQTLAFGLALVGSGYVWSWLWQHAEPGSPVSAAAPATPPAKPWTAQDTAAAMAELKDAKTADARMKAVATLGNIPPGQIRETLEQASVVENGDLTLAAKVLLIRWAGSDGAAAADWAWKRFRSEGLWQEAIREIGPAWAWHDAKGLHRWVMAATKEKPGESTTKAQAEASESPILDSEDVFNIAKWLAPEEPRLAFELRRMERNTVFSGDLELPRLLRTLPQVKEALLAYDDLDQIKPGIMHGHQMLQVALFGRWEELDPEDFARSPYAHLSMGSQNRRLTAGLEDWQKAPATERTGAASAWIAGKEGAELRVRINQLATAWAGVDPEAAIGWASGLEERRREESYQLIAGVRAAKDLNGTLDWGDRLPAASQAATLVTTFDGWSTAHPGQRPDMAGWSEERIAAWKDLEASAAPRPSP